MQLANQGIKVFYKKDRDNSSLCVLILIFAVYLLVISTAFTLFELINKDVIMQFYVLGHLKLVHVTGLPYTCSFKT